MNAQAPLSDGGSSNRSFIRNRCRVPVRMQELDTRRRTRQSIWMYGWAAAALFLLVFVFLKQSWVDSASLNDPRATTRAVAPRGDLAPGEKSTIALFRQASPSVLHITAISVQRDLFTLNLYQIPEGTGSGFVWDYNGNIITNFHVIQNADVAQSDAGGSDHMEGAPRRRGTG